MLDTEVPASTAAAPARSMPRRIVLAPAVGVTGTEVVPGVLFPAPLTFTSALSRTHGHIRQGGDRLAKGRTP
ncbi:hypothetical protein [Amycolatopsis rifamycinica]|uniref:hypothetical protein n=1 Tax=Amycolatopsis rifamycinica TaxID=287986 RepID=UPI0013636482|nr:hypothetical protein [Amycolatopsis rifamycinica]